MLCVSRDRQTDRRTLFSISEISKPCYFVLLARARAKDQSRRQPLGREKITFGGDEVGAGGMTSLLSANDTDRLPNKSLLRSERVYTILYKVPIS